ncbi:hypothetical protein PV08_07953 [Exophiala spinifera]|uniref:Uncharacterized protein n=1 Tax=Exophiala spinifera TaxID=91928 RepID=A0A0D1YCT8_9EURO|nr:uncharacterized protein PV08_07953 [Exophiala spinifera]KIW12766.1 hypothetical protein PV08_07953 [Exophiala spinifera]
MESYNKDDKGDQDRVLPSNQAEKPVGAHTEYVLDPEGEKSISVDYSGAHEKTDPAEIALIKKLDRWIISNGRVNSYYY